MNTMRAVLPTLNTDHTMQQSLKQFFWNDDFIQRCSRYWQAYSKIPRRSDGGDDSHGCLKQAQLSSEVSDQNLHEPDPGHSVYPAPFAATTQASLGQRCDNVLPQATNRAFA